MANAAEKPQTGMLHIPPTDTLFKPNLKVYMRPIIKTISEKKLAGMRLSMNLVNNRTPELWRSFMPRRHELDNKMPDVFYSMQVFDTSYSFIRFDPEAMFEKWAAVEVSNFDQMPEGMESFILPGGLYAVFHHKGPASDGPKVFGYIFGSWLPASPYELDSRPHFETLGETYRADSPDAEEDIWIPIRIKE